MKMFEDSGGILDSVAESAPVTNPSTGTGGSANSFCPPGIGDDCAELLHGLNNALVSILLNAQVMEWKLPSYSRLKRNLREIERNAQRGGELVKRLLQRLEVAKPADLNASPEAIDMPTLGRTVPAMADRVLDERIAKHELPTGPKQRAAAAGLQSRKKVPHTHM